MNREEFNQVVNNRIEHIQTSLAAKNKEYASNDRPLHNFYQSAKAGRTTPKKALFGYMLKHYVSVTDMVMSDEIYPDELWNEKLGDMINYLILLDALQKDERNNLEDKE